MLVGTVPSIGRFLQLQELELRVDWLYPNHRMILSSIASTELRKLVFTTRSAWSDDIFMLEEEAWTWADELLCELVARLGRMGHSHTLEVEFRGDVPHHCDLTKFLPVFKRNGVVTITDSPL
jgi:hypothetical protein